MADAPKILGTDTLRQAYPKLNMMVDLVNTFKEQIDQMVIEGDSSVEAAQARVRDVDGVTETFTTLKNRLDNSDIKIAQKATKGDISVSDINKNLGKLDQSFMTDEFLQQMVGNTPINSVPADGGVTEVKLAEGASSFTKRTRIGELATVILGGSTPIPNIDLVNKRIVFADTFYILVGKKRYTISSGTTIDYTAATQFTPNPVIYFDTKTNSFIAKAQNGTDVSSVPESCVLFAFLVFFGGTTVLSNVFMNCRYTINGVDSTVYFMNEETKNLINVPLGELPLITVSSSGQLPDLRTTSKEVVFPSTFFIFHRNQRYTVTNGITYDFGAKYPSQSGVKLWFDTKNQSTYMTNQTSSGGTTETSILLGVVYLVGDTWRLNINSDYTINGNPLYVPYGQSPSPENANYRFSLDKVYGNASDSNLPGIGDEDSAFDYTNDDHNLVYSLFDTLQQENPAYITKTELGLAYNDIPVFEYTFNPIRPTHSSIKPYPKILIGAAVHGGEGLAVTSLYYLFNRICTEWQNDEKLNYLRHNINFSVVPLRNPGSYNEKLYVYPNGVNINRNFSYGWENSTDETKGTAPFSELETQIQRDWMVANQDALFQIDCHVRGGRQIVDDDKLMWLSCSTEEQAIIAGKTIETMNYRWHEKYPQLYGTQMLGYLTTGEANGTLRSYAYRELGIPTITWEGFSRSTTFTNVENKEVVQMNVDYMIQLVLDIVKKYQ